MSRMALWNMYQNASPPNQQHTTSPSLVQREALNLQRESPSPIPPPRSPVISIKRERDQGDINDYHVPPPKRGLVRTNSDLSRKSSINNNHHHISNNNSHVTPTKVTSKSDRSDSPHTDNGSHHRSPSTHHKQQNGLENLGTTILNGMQFKIISKGKLHMWLLLNEKFKKNHVPRKFFNWWTPIGCEAWSQRHFLRGRAVPEPKLVAIGIHVVVDSFECIYRADAVADEELFTRNNDWRTQDDTAADCVVLDSAFGDVKVFREKMKVQARKY